MNKCNYHEGKERRREESICSTESTHPLTHPLAIVSMEAVEAVAKASLWLLHQWPGRMNNFVPVKIGLCLHLPVTLSGVFKSHSEGVQGQPLPVQRVSECLLLVSSMNWYFDGKLVYPFMVLCDLCFYLTCDLKREMEMTIHTSYFILGWQWLSCFYLFLSFAWRGECEKRTTNNRG